MTVDGYLTWLKDCLERAASTYVQTFIGLLIASPGLNIDKVEAALVAAIPAALWVVKSMLAAGVNKKGTASLAKDI